MNCASNKDHHGDALCHLLDVHTTVHIQNSQCTSTPEHFAKNAITMVYADCVNKSIIVCVVRKGVLGVEPKRVVRTSTMNAGGF